MQLLLQKISSILGQISYGEESKAFGLWVSYFGVKLTILTISEVNFSSCV